MWNAGSGLPLSPPAWAWNRPGSPKREVAGELKWWQILPGCHVPLGSALLPSAAPHGSLSFLLDMLSEAQEKINIGFGSFPRGNIMWFVLCVREETSAPTTGQSFLSGCRIPGLTPAPAETEALASIERLLCARHLLHSCRTTQASFHLASRRAICPTCQRKKVQPASSDPE